MTSIDLTFTGLTFDQADKIMAAAKTTGFAPASLGNAPAGGAAPAAPSAAPSTATAGATSSGTSTSSAPPAGSPPAPPAAPTSAPPAPPAALAPSAPPAASPAAIPSPSGIKIPDDWKAYYASTPATQAMVMEKMQPFGAKYKADGVKALFAKAGFAPNVPQLSQDGLNVMHFAFSQEVPAENYDENGVRKA